MILVTGTSGRIGRRTAEILSSRGEKVRCMSRTPNLMPSIPGSTTVPGDYRNPGSLVEAFEGIERAFIVSGVGEPGKRALLHRNAIEAAGRAGVKHLVYLSGQGASPDSKFPLGRDHFRTEGYLLESGIPFTALRDNFYLDDVPRLFDAEGVARGPAGRGRAAWVSREDVAQTVASVLLSPPPVGAYDVTGPEAVSLGEVARRLSAVWGRELRYEEETREEGWERLKAFGGEDWEVDVWLGTCEAIAAGELERTSSTVLDFTGRKPFGLEGYFSMHPELLYS